MDNLLVLYTVETAPGVCDHTDLNAFEAPILSHSGKDVYLADLLNYLARIKSPFARGFAFQAEFRGELVLLSSPCSVLPIKDDDSVLLHLVKIPNTMTFTLPEQHQFFTAADRALYGQQGTAPLTSSSSSQRLRFSSIPPSESMKVSKSSVPPRGGGLPHDLSKARDRERPPRAPQHHENARHQHTEKNRDRERDRERDDGSGLHAIVGEETAAAINNATEVAKEAAKSLFSWGKSFVDTTSTTLLSGSLLSGLQGNSSAGSLVAGTVLTVGRVRVVVQRTLAEGGFGIVYLAHNEQNASTRYALKTLLVQSREQEREAEVEINSLQRLRHKNIVALLEHCVTPLSGQSSSSLLKQHLLLFPLYSQGTAWDAIEHALQSSSAPWPFSETAVLYIIQQIATALAYIHAQGFAHRDVKPHNILLGERDTSAPRNSPAFLFGTPVLTDFGSVTKKEREIATRQDALIVEDEASRQTSAAYRAPELTSPPMPPARICEKVDVWGLGCTLYCLAFGRSPFETSREGVQKLAILNGKYSVPAGGRQRDVIFSAETLTLLDRMLRIDARERPTAEEVRAVCEKILSQRM